MDHKAVHIMDSQHDAEIRRQTSIVRLDTLIAGLICAHAN
jgi:hypothetical protein